MGQLIGEIFEQYSRYTGTGVFMVLFFVGLVFLAVTENDKEKAGYTVLLHGSVWMAIIIFIPLLYVVYTRLVDAGTYWRFFWLIPMGIGLAYVGTELINDHRVMGFLLIVLVLLLGGNLVYTSDYTFEKAENEYQIPQEVIDLSEIIETHECPVKKAAFPLELLIFIRQYDVDITMPYGREQLDPNWVETENDFFNAIMQDWYDFELIRHNCYDTATCYFVVNRGRQFINNPSSYGFLKIGETRDYEVYYHPGVYHDIYESQN